MSKLFEQTIWFMLNTCFPFGTLEFWYVLGRECICDQPLIKIWGTKPVMNFPSGHFSHVTIYPWRNKFVLCGSTGKRKFEPGLLGFTSFAFSLC